MELVIGQILWFVPHYPRLEKNGYEVYVNNIDDKWAYLSNGQKVSRKSFADGGYAECAYWAKPPGSVFKSLELYLEISQRRQAWDELNQILSNRAYSPPSHMTAKCIKEIIRTIKNEPRL